jgi:DNA-binding protein HU-beta
MSKVQNVQYNKEDLVIAIVGATKCSKAQAEEAVNSTFAGLQDLVAKMNPGDKLQLVGKMSVEVVNKPAHEGSNPRTKEKIQIAEKNFIKVKFGSEIVDVVKQPGAKKEKADKADAKTTDKAEKGSKGKADKKEAKAEKGSKGKGKADKAK